MILSVFPIEGKINPHETNELVLDGGFVMPKQTPNGGFEAPEINAFGNNFRSIFFLFSLFNYGRARLHLGFLKIINVASLSRNYDAETERQKSVEEFYFLQHIHQTYDFVSPVNLFSIQLNYFSETDREVI